MFKEFSSQSRNIKLCSWLFIATWIGKEINDLVTSWLRLHGILIVLLPLHLLVSFISLAPLVFLFVRVPVGWWASLGWVTLNFLHDIGSGYEESFDFPHGKVQFAGNEFAGNGIYIAIFVFQIIFIALLLAPSTRREFGVTFKKSKQKI